MLTTKALALFSVMAVILISVALVPHCHALPNGAIAAPNHPPRPSPPPKGLGPAILVDSTGAQIGLFDWNSDFPFSPDVPTVLLKVNRVWLAVAADGNGFKDLGGTIYYATNDCSGTAYYDESVSNPVVGSSFSANGILHYADPRLPQSQQMFSNEFIYLDGTIHGGCQSVTANGYFSPDQTLDLSTLGFVPPFTLSVSGVCKQRKN
jgi:hypothetical protein